MQRLLLRWPAQGAQELGRLRLWVGAAAAALLLAQQLALMVGVERRGQAARLEAVLVLVAPEALGKDHGLVPQGHLLLLRELNPLVWLAQP